MRFAIILIALFVPPSFAFVPATVPTTSIHCITMTTLNMHRREVLTTGFLGMLTIPVVANASSSTFFYDEKIEQVNEPSQMATDGRVDLNSAFVGDYKYFPGMYPTAAGKIASHGPYGNVRDIYKIEGLTETDKKLFKKYEKYFTVNPPGRSFKERINGRVST